MERIFKKNFVYAADCYEIWQNQKCIEQKKTDAEILGITCGDSILVCFLGKHVEGLPMASEFHLNSPMSMILRPDDNGLINEGRIQYFNDGFYETRNPYICHLFCKFGRISYVRLATPIVNSDPQFPLPDKLYEFYGDMIEMGSCSDYFKERIVKIISSMIQFSNNAYGITMDKSLNDGMVWKDMTNIYKRELLQLSKGMDSSRFSWEDLVLQYTENQIVSYFNGMGYIPMFTIDHICKNVYDVAKEIPLEYDIETIEQFKLKVIYDLTIKQTSDYKSY